MRRPPSSSPLSPHVNPVFPSVRLILFPKKTKTNFFRKIGFSSIFCSQGLTTTFRQMMVPFVGQLQFEAKKYLNLQKNDSQKTFWKVKLAICNNYVSIKFRNKHFVTVSMKTFLKFWKVKLTYL